MPSRSREDAEAGPRFLEEFDVVERAVGYHLAAQQRIQPESARERLTSAAERAGSTLRLPPAR